MVAKDSKPASGLTCPPLCVPHGACCAVGDNDGYNSRAQAAPATPSRCLGRRCPTGSRPIPRSPALLGRLPGRLSSVTSSVIAAIATLPYISTAAPTSASVDSINRASTCSGRANPASVNRPHIGCRTSVPHLLILALFWLGCAVCGAQPAPLPPPGGRSRIRNVGGTGRLVTPLRGHGARRLHCEARRHLERGGRAGQGNCLPGARNVGGRRGGEVKARGGRHV